MAIVPSTSVGGGGGTQGTELFYAEITSNVTIASSTEATPTTIVSLGAQTYAAVPTLLEFFCAGFNIAANTSVIFCLWGDGAELARWGDVRTASTTATPVNLRYRFTPTAASHTYLVAAIRSSANTDVNAGTGTGGSGLYMPAFLRATLV